jgi:hypothetical protein
MEVAEAVKAVEVVLIEEIVADVAEALVLTPALPSSVVGSTVIAMEVLEGVEVAEALGVSAVLPSSIVALVAESAAVAKVVGAVGPVASAAVCAPDGVGGADADASGS